LNGFGHVEPSYVAFSLYSKKKDKKERECMDAFSLKYERIQTHLEMVLEGLKLRYTTIAIK
jgi:hypothetical protein